MTGRVNRSDKIACTGGTQGRYKRLHRKPLRRGTAVASSRLRLQPAWPGPRAGDVEAGRYPTEVGMVSKPCRTGH
jgi:hypothetical protein